MTKQSNKSLSQDNIVGVILAGGQSSRMGGIDKFLLPINQTNMLSLILDRFKKQIDTIIISANGDNARLAEFNLPVVNDPVDEDAGPLAGILAAMIWAQKNKANSTHILSIGADTPFFPPSLALKFLNASAEHTDKIIMAKSNNQFHPIIGLWPVMLIESLRDAIRNKMYKIRAWSDTHPNKAITFENEIIKGQPVDPFFNVNTPEDFALLKTIYQRTETV